LDLKLLDLCIIEFLSLSVFFVLLFVLKELPKKKVWGLTVPTKVGNFFWRACKNAIPTKSNLVRQTAIETRLVTCVNAVKKMFCTLCC